jgi:hypothetical protein
MTKLQRPSVQPLLIQMQFKGQALATGTAFVAHAASGPVLVTNRHNVTGRHQDTDAPLSKSGGVPDEIVVIHNEKGRLGSWLPRVEKLHDANGPRWREHPQLGAKADFVALPLTALDNVDLHPHNVGNDRIPDIQVGPADPVSVVGFPFGLTGGGALAVWATGFMATEPDINFSDLPALLIDCRTRQGQSGSPVIAYRVGGMVAMADGGSAAFSGPVCRFLGIYSGRINSESDLGFVWKASAIRELLNSV